MIAMPLLGRQPRHAAGSPSRRNRTKAFPRCTASAAPYVNPFVQRLIRLIPLWLVAAGAAHPQHLSDLSVPRPVAAGDTLVLGFLGGIEKWDDERRGVRKTVLQLRQMGLPGVWTESLANRRMKLGVELVRRAFDWNANGRLDPDEARQARVILFGQSLGGAAAIRCARELEKAGAPVLLTVQVDSVGAGDGVIPANVRAAANFYQREPLTIWGRSSIRAADPSRTAILRNQRFHYPFFLPAFQPESWMRRNLGGGHARMEADPFVWAEVLGLIRAAIIE
jgi:hypothetical protein